MGKKGLEAKTKKIKGNELFEMIYSISNIKEIYSKPDFLRKENYLLYREIIKDL